MTLRFPLALKVLNGPTISLLWIRSIRSFQVDLEALLSRQLSLGIYRMITSAWMLICSGYLRDKVLNLVR